MTESTLQKATQTHKYSQAIHYVMDQGKTKHIKSVWTKARLTDSDCRNQEAQFTTHCHKHILLQSIFLHTQDVKEYLAKSDRSVTLRTHHITLRLKWERNAETTQSAAVHVTAHTKGQAYRPSCWDSCTVYRNSDTWFRHRQAEPTRLQETV